MSDRQPHVVCTLCSCRMSWDDLGEDEFLCDACGHSLHDDHVAIGVPLTAAEPAIA